MLFLNIMINWCPIRFAVLHIFFSCFFFFWLQSLGHLFGCLHTCSLLYMCTCLAPHLFHNKPQVSEIHYISCRFYFNSIKTFPQKKRKKKRRYLCVFCMFANRRSARVCVVGSKVGYTFQLINPLHIKTTYLLSLLLCQLVAHINGWQDSDDDYF